MSKEKDDSDDDKVCPGQQIKQKPGGGLPPI